MGDGALGLLPDFRAGADVVGFRIVAVGELVEHLATATALQAFGQVAGPFHALLAAHQDQLGAVGGHGGLAFGAHVVGHDQHHLVALDGGGHGQGDAGVAGGGLDQGVAGLDVAAQLGAGDHRQGRAILDRTGRVVAFEFDQERVAGFAGQALQTDQRGVADAVGDGGVLQSHGGLRNPDAGGAYDSGKPCGAISRIDCRVCPQVRWERFRHSMHVFRSVRRFPSNESLNCAQSTWGGWACTRIWVSRAACSC
ncbi:hypothetical protein FQZ97_802170 [compost metagenome]